jgi:hypothetical protein
VSSYRQISIAIRKKLVDTQSQTVTSVGALQTCHSEETERQHYALTTSGPRYLGAESFEEFRSASTAWYKFVLGASANIGFVSAGKPSTSNPQRPAAQRDVDHPSTPHVLYDINIPRAGGQKRAMSSGTVGLIVPSPPGAIKYMYNHCTKTPSTFTNYNKKVSFLYIYYHIV